MLVRSALLGSTIERNSYSFNGTSSFVQTAADANLVIGAQDFTYECWAKLNAAQSVTILGYGAYGSSSTFEVYASSSALSGSPGAYQFRVLFGGSIVQTASIGYVPGTWYHLAMVRSGTAFRLYVNGSQATDNTSSFNLSSNVGLTVGRRYNNSSAFLNGLVSNVRLRIGTASVPSVVFPIDVDGSTKLLALKSSTVNDVGPYGIAVTPTSVTLVTNDYPQV